MTQLKERSFEEPKQLIPEVKLLLDKASTRNFTFLLVGRTGVGKSSTINTLMGEKVAEVGKFRPVTKSIEEYKSKIEGILPYTVFDTPGLADNNEKDQEYISFIKSAVPESDSMWFITILGESRVRDDEKNTIKAISSAFGEQGWQKAIIVFTYADKVDRKDYNNYLTERTKLIQEEIARYINTDIAQQIPSVAVANNPKGRKPLLTPDDKPWLNELYTTVLKRISDQALPSIVLGTAPRVIPQDTNSQEVSSSSEAEPILLDERHKPQVRERIEGSPEFEKVVKVATGAATATKALPAIAPILLAGAKLLTWLWDSDSLKNLTLIQNLDLKIQELNKLQDEDDWSFRICSNYKPISKTFKAAPNVESFIEINIEKAEPIVINLDLTLSPDERQDSLPYIAIMGFYPSKAVRSIVTNLSLVNESLEVVIEDILVLLDPDEQELPTENIPSFSTQVILFAVDCRENQ